jgi:zinc/manganese transport system permease protein
MFAPGAALGVPEPSLDLVADLQQLLQYPFMRNALAAGTIVAVLAGVLGWFVVLRGQTYAAHTLSLVGFPGAAGAVLIGVAPLYGLVGFCLLASAGIVGLSRGGISRTTESAIIGSVQAVALALGFFFVGLYGGFLNGVTDRLFGTVVGITSGDVVALLVTAAIALAAMAAIGRPLLFASVDPDVAAARGVPVGTVSVVFLLILGLAVAEVSQVTGSLLVFALLVAPAAAAQQLTSRPWLGILLSVAIGVSVTWLGMAITYFTVYPIGFFVTSLAFAVYLVALAGRTLLALQQRRLRPAV